MRVWETAELAVESGHGPDHRGDRHLYAGPDQWIGVVGSEAPGGAEGWAKLLAASPLVTQALLSCGDVGARDERWHLDGCIGIRSLVECMPRCAESRGALTKAGALP